MLPFRFCPSGLLSSIRRSAARCCIAAVFLGLAAAFAHEGHDHDEAATSTLPSSAFPRVIAQSELYEAVAIIKNERFSVYLDNVTTNEPVTNAKVTVTIGGNDPIDTEPGENGSYTGSFPRLSGTNSVEVVFAITGGNGDDLLVGTLAAPQAPRAPSASAAQAGPARWIGSLPLPLRNPALLAVVAFGLGILVGHFHRSGRFVPAMATAAGAAVVLIFLVAVALSDTDHDHDGPKDAAKSETLSDAPRRLPDGSAFIAKPTQRLLEVRTVAAKPETIRSAVHLIGRVIGDPNRTSLVQSIHAGRVVAPEGGLPGIGQTVRNGDVVAQVESHLPLADRTTISEKAGEIEQLIAVTEARLQRLRYLVSRGTALQSQVVEAELELDGLRRRRELIRNTRVEAAEILRAPTAGVIAVAKVVPGQVVQAQDVLFQIVDPKGLWVEALVYGELAPNSLDEATAIATGGQTMALVFQGFSRALQQHAAIVHFAIPEPPPNLNLGQPVTVAAKTGAPITGLVVRRDAVVRSGSGEAIVWLHVEPERFEARPVRTQPFDATRLIVAAGVTEGERIVIRGADLINQIR